MNISIWSITYQHYEYMHNFGGGRSDLFNSGGGGGEGYFQNSGGSWHLAKRGELINSGGFGPWMKLCHSHEVQLAARVPTLSNHLICSN